MPQSSLLADIDKALAAPAPKASSVLEELDAALAEPGPSAPEVQTQKSKAPARAFTLPSSMFGANQPFNPPARNPVGELMGGGMADLAIGGQELATGQYEGRVTGAARVLEGAMQVGTPTIIGGVLTAPAQTVAALVLGMGTQNAVNYVAKITGKTSPWTRLASDLAGIVAGGAAAKTTDGLLDLWKAAKAGRTAAPAAAPDAPKAPAGAKVAKAPVAPTRRTAVPTGNPVDLLEQIDTALGSDNQAREALLTPPPKAPSSAVTAPAKVQVAVPEPVPAVEAPPAEPTYADRVREGFAKAWDAGDPSQAPQNPTEWPVPEIPKQFTDLTPSEKTEVRRILAELEEFKFEDPARDWKDWKATTQRDDNLAPPRQPNADIYQQFNIDTRRTGKQIRNAIERYINGKAPTTVAQDAVKLARRAVLGESLGRGQGSLPPEAGFNPDDYPDIEHLYGGLGMVGDLGKDAAKIVRAVQREYRERIAPKTASPAAARTADVGRDTFADIANAEDLRAQQGKSFERQFGKRSDVVNQAAISEYERSGLFSSDPAYTKIFKESMAQAHDWLEEAFGKDKVGFIENYVLHAFKFGTEADRQKASSVLQGRIRGSLSANRRVLRQRALRMPLEDALTTMRAAGIEVEPVSSNPEILRRWALNNAYRALRFKEMGDTLKNEGLIRFVRTGQTPPSGSVPLSDRRFQIYFKGDQGLVKAGAYYADPPVAKLLDRAISTGEASSPTFRVLRSVNNAWNMVNLGLSAFHATETALNASTSDLALAAMQLSKGRVIDAAVSFARSPYAGVRDLVNGARFRNALRRSDPAALKILDERVNPAGARLALENRYRNNFVEKFRATLANQEWVKSAGYLPLAAIEMTSKPLMEYAVPRIKIGAFLDLAAEMRKQMPNASRARLEHAYGQAWDSIDNRLGMLTYDNLFWNRTAVDIGQLAFRSLGWNHGTELELGGGLKDAKQLFTKGVLTSRLAYTMALPVYVGMIGAIYQYLHTGKGPQELKDFFYPKNGLKDASGNDDRVTIKSYMGDAINFIRDPVRTVGHKVGPLLEWASSMLSNENYFGDLIRNPNDPIGKQLQQAGKFTLEQWPPISIVQAMQQQKEGRSLEQSVERGLAIQKAPSWAIKSDLQKAAEAAVGERLGARHRTPEQVETDELKFQARREIAAGGKSPALAKLIKQGTFTTPQQILDFMKTANQTPLQRTLGSLPIATRLKLLREHPRRP